MVISIRSFIAVAVLALVGGCSAANPQPRPSAVSHMDVAQKKAYIHGAESTMKIFHAAALDLRSRGKFESQEELAGEVKRYVDLHVKPIVGDFEAGNSLDTRIEIAKLQLLCGVVYLELEDYWEALKLLREMEKRYGDQPDLLSATIDRSDIGFGTIEDGMRRLEEQLFSEAVVLPPPSLRH